MPANTASTGDSFSTGKPSSISTKKRLTLPAVLAAQKGLNEPRYPTLKGIMGAKKKEIKDLKAVDLGLAGETSQLSVTALEALPPRPPGRIIQGDVPTAAKELVRSLREDAKAI